MFAGTALSVRLFVCAGLSLFIICGPYLSVVVCVFYAYNLTWGWSVVSVLLFFSLLQNHLLEYLSAPPLQSTGYWKGCFGQKHKPSLHGHTLWSAKPLHQLMPQFCCQDTCSYVFSDSKKCRVLFLSSSNESPGYVYAKCSDELLISL